ncbi:MAG: DUF3788 domain-containing protein [Oscillospiraceae bacterium]
MDMPSNNAVEELIGLEKTNLWNSLAASIDRLYDMDRIWNKGFGDWVYEYKYRRGGKTLCTFYAKNNTANILIIFGKTEREKFESQRNAFSEQILELYDTTETYHDGKWLWIPIDDNLSFDDILNMLKMKRKPNRK